MNQYPLAGKVLKCWASIYTIALPTIKVNQTSKYMKFCSSLKRSRQTYVSKILLVMKLTIFLLVTTFVQISTAANAQRATINEKNITLEKVFTLLSEQTGYKFLYTGEMLNQSKPVTVQLNNVTIEEALKICLSGQPLTYAIKQNTVILRRKPDDNISQVAITVSGKVTDKNGAPLSGVSVLLKNSSIGVSTNAEGLYSINIPSGTSTLVFVYMGFATKEVAVNNQNKVDVVMEQSSFDLNEVVAVGYGTQRRGNITTAISSLKIDDSNQRIGALSPVQLLQGRIAGVNMSLSSGNLGSRERVSIRGASSLSASNEPLYVIDGIPIMNSNGNLFDFGESMSSLSTLNLTDIESIDVLKDAASAAIYGSRATNGVVLITTKSGKNGKTEIRGNFSTGLSSFAYPNKVKYADSKLYTEQYNDGANNYNRQYGYTVGNAAFVLPAINPHPSIADPDWLGLILQQGKQTNANVSFGGGSPKTKFYTGLAYSKQDGMVKTNAIEKINFNAKVSHELAPWLEVGTTINGGYLKNNQVPGPNNGATILARATQKRPFDLPYKPDGEYYIGGTDELAYHNPVQILNEEVSKIDNYRFLGSFYANVKFLKKFSFRTSLYSDIGYTYDYLLFNAKHPYGLGTGRLVDNSRFTFNNTIDNVLDYNDKFGEFTVSGMAGHSFQKITSRSTTIDGNGFPSPAFDVIGVAAQIAGTNGSLSEFALESYFGRGTVDYKNKYSLSALIRTDGSSKFAPSVRWGVFPSVSLGWNVSNEEFFKSPKTDLKLRASYGKTGNQEAISNYASLPLMSGGLNYGYNVGIGVTSFGNDQLTWETATQYNAGFDLGLKNGKINIIFDVYQKNTDNLLYNKPTPATSGVTSNITNIGSMQNRGVELSFNTTYGLGPVQWTSQFNIAFNQNKLTSLLGEDLIAIGANRALKVGEQLGVFYLYQMDGIYQYDGEIPQAQYDIGVRAGDVKWHDVDGNGIINDNDRVLMGSSNPKFSGGWNNTFKYKGFQLDVFAHYMSGNNTYSEWKQTSLARVGYLAGVLTEYAENRWTGPGTTNKYARAINGSARSGYNTLNSDRFLEDGSFLRLRTVTLAYTFTPKILAQIKLKSLRVYAQADNLMLFTPYSGYDPEVTNNLDPSKYGVDIFSMPAPRTINFGLNIGL
jgi:TonB-linked SusC/RagA family outer membrane protein